MRYLPATQSRHVAATEASRVAEYLPAAQSIQELTPGAPGVVRYLPAPQSVHEAATEAPRVAEYLPATQLMHVSVAEAPNVVEYLPTPQSRHMEAPVMILYFPAVHAAHDTPLSPVNPPLQRQLLERILPLGENESLGQLMHVLDAEAPIV
jgi:hypothetical protein